MGGLASAPMGSRCPLGTRTRPCGWGPRHWLGTRGQGGQPCAGNPRRGHWRAVRTPCLPQRIFGVGRVGRPRMVLPRLYVPCWCTATWKVLDWESWGRRARQNTGSPRPAPSPQPQQDQKAARCGQRPASVPLVCPLSGPWVGHGGGDLPTGALPLPRAHLPVGVGSSWSLSAQTGCCPSTFPCSRCQGVSP